MIERLLKNTLVKQLASQAVVGLLGPRQVGKTTLAREISQEVDSVYLDLELDSDVRKLSDPFNYLSGHQGKLVIIDEIQRVPGLFKTLRPLVDQNRRDGYRYGQFLILGSASVELICQSAESLAGRINYLEVSGLNVLEAAQSSQGIDHLWVRGGFPDSYLAADDETSFTWRQNFIRTYLERDIPQLGPRIPAKTLHNFWTMLAHVQATMVNASKIASGLDVSSPTVSRYIDLMVDLLLVRKLHPWSSNVGKRLVKSPKLYVRDSGLVHQLLGIPTQEILLGNPILGQSWEGFVIENLLSVLKDPKQAFFYRTVAGAEIDLLIEFSNKDIWAIEIKRTTAPSVKKGFHNACEDINPSKKFVVYNGIESYPLANGIQAIGLRALMEMLIDFQENPFR